MTSSPGGKTCTTTTATSCTITGLKPGTHYVFTVKAINAVGTSSGANSASTLMEGISSIGQFLHNLSTTTSSVTSSALALARTIKADGITTVTLYGYGNLGAPANLSVARAQTVKTLLLADLANLGVTGVSISVAGGANTTAFNNGSTGPENRVVTATIS